MQALTRASQSVVERLEGEDEASLMTFSDRLSLLASSVRDRVAVERQMLAISPKSGERTALWDAVFVGLSFAAREPGPSVVLLFTDGIDTASWCDAQRIREVIKHTEAVVYAVTVPPIPATGPGVVRADTEEERERLQTIDRARESFVPKDLKEVVEQSGGELFLAGRGEELADRFVTVLRDVPRPLLADVRTNRCWSRRWLAPASRATEGQSRHDARQGWLLRQASRCRPALTG